MQQILRLWGHALWADEKLLDALRTDGVPSEALREYAHIMGTYEVWLSRLQRRPARAAVWPEASLPKVEVLWNEVKAAYGEFLSALGPADLDRRISYTNSAGREFTSSVGDILMHVALHGQYHRGKVNLLLRGAGLEPVPSDYIAFVRGAPAATRADET